MDHHFPPANPADAQYYNYPTPQPETLMGVEQLVALVERIGLPAVIIGAAFWFIPVSYTHLTLPTTPYV